jgi:mitochondrial intermembrane space import and assembly protein 40
MPVNSAEANAPAPSPVLVSHTEPDSEFSPDAPPSPDPPSSPNAPSSPDAPLSPDAPPPEGEEGQGGAFNPVTGEINWDCPCLGGMAHGPCGPQFREAFSCFVFSEEEPKGIECVEKFKAMQDCFREHPDVYAEGELVVSCHCFASGGEGRVLNTFAEIMDDEEEEEASGNTADGNSSAPPPPPPPPPSVPPAMSSTPASATSPKASPPGAPHP